VQPDSFECYGRGTCCSTSVCTASESSEMLKWNHRKHNSSRNGVI